MHQVKSYKRGWVAEAPAGALEACLAADEAERSRKSAVTFEWQEDGHWRVVLRATEDTKSFADVTLDVNQDCLRVAFPGQSPQLIRWPPGIGAAEMDSCSARFSKRRGELTITLPMAENVEPPTESSPAERSRVPATQASVRKEDLAKSDDVSSKQSGIGNASGYGYGDKLTSAIRSAKDNVKSWHPELNDPRLDNSPDSSSSDSVDPVALQMAGTWMLHSAAATGDVAKLQSLLKANIDANASDESGVSALEKACMSVHPEAVSALLSGGAKVNGISTSASTPLHRAVAVGARGRRIVQVLCDSGASRTAKDRSGRTPVDLAREMGLEPLPEDRKSVV